MEYSTNIKKSENKLPAYKKINRQAMLSCTGYSFPASSNIILPLLQQIQDSPAPS